MKCQTVRGILTVEDGRSFILGEDGTRYFEDDPIWSGYTKHWTGRKVYGRLLKEKDYETNKPMAILWPDEPRPESPFVEFYYNERLVKYMASTFGHNAINVDGGIYNFSHKINENEVMSEEEFFYRPALGEFAPSPRTGMFEVPEEGPPYFDKFGRNFMRTIHVLELKGLDTEQLKSIYDRELDVIRNTPPKPDRPDHYADFSIWNRSCSTIIRDGLKELGYPKISGIFPHDLFVSAATVFSREQKLSVRIYRRKQLTVPEAEPSASGPFTNPVNIFRNRKLDYTSV